MDEKRIQKLIKYWLETADSDWATVQVLFDGKRYVEALFWGHLILEKVLKACVVQTTREEAPKIHDLMKLARIAEIDLSEEEFELLDGMNIFNLEARYPDTKLAAHKVASKDFAQKYLKKIKIVYQKLCLNLK